MSGLSLGPADLSDRQIRPFASGIFKTYSVDLPGGRILAKIVTPAAMAEAELDGLQGLSSAGVLVPAQYGMFRSGTVAALFMELIETGKADSAVFLRGMYTQQATSFGYDRDNYIGSLPQSNQRYATFSAFWWESRIEPQCKIALGSGLLDTEDVRRAETMVRRRVESWHLDQCKPSLIHGDLWNGNVLFNCSGESVLIDPSVAFGHPEQDLAMLELFGSPISSLVLDQIALERGLPPGRQERAQFFQLYPLLVHVNLFGAGYAAGVRRVLRHYE